MSDASYDGWLTLVDELGASLTAILEVIGLRAQDFVDNGEQLVTFDDLADEAQAIDRARRSRRQ